MRAPDVHRYLVWRLGQALLAAPVADVVEAAPMSDRGVGGAPDLELIALAGLEPEGPVRLAVVVRTPAGRHALPAEAVEGVLEAGPGHVTAPPSWLGPVTREAVAGLIRLADGRIAAVVDLAAVAGE